MNVYICDGSQDGFFTAVFHAFKDAGSVITSDGNVQMSLDCNVLQVEGDIEKSERVQRGLMKYDREAPEDIAFCLRSCDGRKEQILFNYIKAVFARKCAIKTNYNLPEVVDFNDILYKITGETHRLKGLLRFMESANGAYYAPYSPDNDITELLMRHFAGRFKNEKFVIHDIKRKIAGFYDGARYIMGYAGDAEICLSDRERAFETLWKKYYNAVNVAERPHEKQMKRSMPVRYWKFLPEKSPHGN